MNDIRTDLYLFHQGTNFAAYRFLGCHMERTAEGHFLYTFRTWAPKAHHVDVVGEFCGWDAGLAMHRVSDGGVW